MYTTEYSQLTLGVSTRPSGARHDPRQNSSNHRLKAGWKPKSSMSCWRLSLYLPFAKSKETLTSAWAVKRSEIGGLGGRSAHAREAVAACPVSGPHPWSSHARQACAEEARGAELSCPLLYPKGRASRGAACVIAHDVRSIHPGQVAYWTFNKVTGYKAADPTPESVAFRLIFLESVAAVPGMVAAQHRHFRSLRKCASIPASIPSPSSSPQACPAISLAALAGRPTQR